VLSLMASVFYLYARMGRPIRVCSYEMTIRVGIHLLYLFIFIYHTGQSAQLIMRWKKSKSYCACECVINDSYKLFVNVS